MERGGREQLQQELMSWWRWSGTRAHKMWEVAQLSIAGSGAGRRFVFGLWGLLKALSPITFSLSRD